jgi:hypothetical protein
MLVIREAQMAVFVEHLAEAFKRQLAEYLAGHHVAEVTALGDGGLEKLITEGLASAREVGFDTEYDCARWVEILLVHGADFGRTEATAWAAPVLADRVRKPSDRMAQIESRLEAEERGRRRAGAAPESVPPHA